MKTTDTTIYDDVISEVDQILHREITRDEKLFAVCEVMADMVPHFDWVGFYYVDPESPRELVLGPFIGDSTDHTRIPFGKGICGQVAVSHETYISQNVHEEDNYISCSIHVQSEIVVPIMKDGEFVAQMDIDSNTRNSITPEHQKLVEDICNKLSQEF